MIDVKVMSRIQKLLARTIENGCTPAEAEAAWHSANGLLLQHNLSLHEVQSHRLHESVIEQQIPTKYKRVPVGVQHLATALIQALGCRPVFLREPGRLQELVIIGVPDDVKLAAFLIDTLIPLCACEADRRAVKKSIPSFEVRRFRDSFLKGCGDSILTRLNRHEKLSEQDASRLTAIVVVKERAVQDFVDRKLPGLKIKNMKNADLDSPYVEGRQYGASMPITSGIASASPLSVGTSVADSFETPSLFGE